MSWILSQYRKGDDVVHEVAGTLQDACQGQFTHGVHQLSQIFGASQIERERGERLGAGHETHTRFGHDTKVALAEQALEVRAYAPLVRVPSRAALGASSGTD